MTQDQVFVPRTRSQRGLPPLNAAGEDLLGSRVSMEVQKELWDALGDSPIGALFGAASYLVSRFVMELLSIMLMPSQACGMAHVPHQECVWSIEIS